MSSLEVLTVGRVGVDLYPLQSGPLSEVTTFAKYLGGTATNVCVGLARLGRRAAVLTKVGADPFGDFVRQALIEYGASPEHVGTSPGLKTPVVFCELDPPEDPPIYFYRDPIAPDLTITADDVPWDVVREVPLLWVTGTGLSREPSRSTHFAMLEERGRPEPDSGFHTVFDLDWRPTFWPDLEQAREHYERAVQHCSVVVGNRAEVEQATGTDDPGLAAKRLLAAGVQWAVVKLGGDGVLVSTLEGSALVEPHRVSVVCGLGAGDAFGAALAHGLLNGDDPTTAVVRANAAGALVAASLACSDAMPTLPELDMLITTEGQRS